MCHVTNHNPRFDFAETLRRAVVEGRDSLPNGSPPDSPAFGGSDLSELTDLSDLSDLSDLANGPTPTASSSQSQTARIHNEVKEESKENVSHTTRSAKRKARRNERNREWRKKARAHGHEAINSHHKARAGPREKYVDKAQPILCNFDTATSAVTSTAYVALDQAFRPKKIYKLSEVTGEGSRFKFRLVEWDGVTPTPIIDNQRRIIGILAGHPNDERWPELQLQAAAALESRRSKISVPKSKRRHRRGAFPALQCGVSHGGGQHCPSNLYNNTQNAKILAELNNLEPFRRTAGFASSVMATWTPDLHRYYTDTINELHTVDPSLQRIFPSGVFSAATYNLGPRTVCYPHIDGGNLVYGSCSVSPYGKFDHTKGGHLILWDLHLVIQFPAGSTILLPSSIIAHSNTAIGKDETRYSFAQYTAGAIFRWVENGCMKRETYLSSLSPQELSDDVKRNTARWEFGLSLLPIAPEAEQADETVLDPDTV